MAENKEKNVLPEDEVKEQAQPAQEETVPETEVETEETKEELKEPEEMVEVTKSRLKELEQAEAKFLEDLKRERAESINYRKRLQKQRDEFAEIASARVLAKLLSVHDDLSRVIENGIESIPKEHMEGIELVGQRIAGIFQSEAVSLIKVEEGKTRYDPHFHEAIVAQPVPDVAPNTVIAVVNQGFRKGDRVLRPAKVMISKQPPAPPTEQKSDEDKTQGEEPEMSETASQQQESHDSNNNQEEN